MYTMQAEFIESIASPLGWYYVVMTALNVAAAGHACAEGGAGADLWRGWGWLRSSAS